MSSKKILLDYCRLAVGILRQQCEAASLIGHRASMGEVRETILKDFLRDHLPELVNITSGVIIDHEGATSRQQDVVLVLKSMPRLPFSDQTQLIFMEGVLAVVEIKSMLDGDAMRRTCENITSVKALKHAGGAGAQMGVILGGHRWPGTEVFTALVAYGGISFEAVQAACKDVESTKRPDLVLDLSRGIMVKNGGLLPPEGIGDWRVIDDPAVGFMVFLTVLTEITGTLTARGVNWRAYWP